MPFKDVSHGRGEPYLDDLASATEIDLCTRHLKLPTDDHANKSPEPGRWIPSNMSVQDSAPRQPQGIDLQLCLLNLPTPIVALDRSRAIVFANRAAEDLLSYEDPMRPRDTIIGRELTNMDMTLLSHKSWKHVLDNYDSDQSPHDDGTSTDAKVHEVEVVVERHGMEGGSKAFRILLSSQVGDGTAYILSFERISEEERKQRSNTISGPPTDAEMAEFRDTQWYKAATFDDSDVPGFIISADAKFYIPNKKTKELFSDAIGGPQKHSYPYDMSYSEYWDEDFTQRVPEDKLPGLRIVKERKPYKNVRYGYKIKSTGMRFILTGNGQCLYDEAGQFIGGVCWFSTFQKLSEFLDSEKGKDLRSHETICNLLPHMVWTTKGDAVSADWFSKRWFDYTGMTEEEAVGQGFAKAFHPDDLPRIKEQLEKHNNSKEEFQIQLRFRRHDGCYRWMIARAAPILGPDGEILRWYGTNTDIHEATVARLEADNIKDQVMSVLAHTDLSVFAIDKERKITMSEGQALKIAARLRGMEASEFVGMDSVELANALDLPGTGVFEDNLQDILSRKVNYTETEDAIEQKVYKTRMVADLDDTAEVEEGARQPLKGVLGVVVDVTDMKARAKLEIDNARLSAEEQAAKNSNRMKSQFLANMSHELRTPTSGVIGMIDLLCEDETLTHEQRECVNSIQLSAKTLLTIVNDILDFSKIESGRFDIDETPFSLASTLHGLCQLLTMFAQRKGLRFICENNLDEAIEFIGDAGRIRQVLSNLLMNALKFTSQGMVKITISGDKLDTKEDENEVLQVRFVIEDTGIGIQKNVLDSLFTPFQQGDASTARLYGGTGLGLTISQNLARLMHGSIELRSTPDVGSTATFTLPLRVSAWSGEIPIARTSSQSQILAQSLRRGSTHRDILNQEISSMVSSSRESSHHEHGRSSETESDEGPDAVTLEKRRHIHVLVVEDNAINQTIALKIIEKLGFPVSAVWNGREALDYIKKSSPEEGNREGRPVKPDIILMDVQMPVMDGYDATRIIRSGEKEYTVLEENTAPDDQENKGKESTKSVVEGIEAMPDLPIIAMTASAIQGDREKCTAAGMDDYLPKPVNKDKLEHILTKWSPKARP